MENDDDNSPFFRGRTNYDWNSTIMVSAIISLSFVVILVTILYVYARCILQRQARRQAALRHLTIITAGSATEPPRRGLDPSIIASLPIFLIKQPNTSEMGSMECSVCLSILEDGEMGRTLPNCKHTFHAECVDKWFVSNSTCPVCRTEAEPRPPRESTLAVVVQSPPSAPPAEGTLDGGGLITQPSPKVSGSSSISRLSSFKRILSRERSSKSMQTQSCAQEDGLSDVERQ